jgi:hypothetical protein
MSERVEGVKRIALEQSLQLPTYTFAVLCWENLPNGKKSFTKYCIEDGEEIYVFNEPLYTNLTLAKHSERVRETIMRAGGKITRRYLSPNLIIHSAFAPAEKVLAICAQYDVEGDQFKKNNNNNKF